MIVQSNKEKGVITLRAASENLKSCEAVIQTSEVSPRPIVLSDITGK